MKKGNELLNDWVEMLDETPTRKEYVIHEIKVQRQMTMNKDHPTTGDLTSLIVKRMSYMAIRLVRSPVVG